MYILPPMVIVVGALYLVGKGNKTSDHINNVASSATAAPTVPHTNIDTKSWIATTSSGYSFNYPKDFGTSYVSIVDWPPQIAIEESPYVCQEGGASESLPAGKTQKNVINNKEYCVTKESEGAAGSIYTNYAYAFSYQNNTMILTFSLRQPQCMNYDDPKQTECVNEEKEFNPDPTIDAITTTIK